MRSKLKFIYLNPVVWFLFIWGISLLRCEILTFNHAYEFTETHKENTMVLDIEYAKILKYSKTHARIYYVSKDYVGADILTFVKENDVWRQGGWDTVWSASGSADNTVWPYWWHFFYSHSKL
ncbi:MAG: hypothetical protein M0R40_09085 [Firmicutes bacterium]|nr:hypothetical protein [Bacillota bacterium]